MRRYSIFLIAVVTTIFIFSCSKTTAPEVEPDAVIQSPTTTEEYTPYNIIYLLLKYDTTKWYPTFVWQFSKDSGKTWERVTEMQELHSNQKSWLQPADGPYHYDVRRWKTVDNQLESDIDLQIRVSAYNNAKFTVKKPIRLRKP